MAEINQSNREAETQEAIRVLLSDAATYMEDVAKEFLANGVTPLTAARCNRQAEKIRRMQSALSLPQ